MTRSNDSLLYHVGLSLVPGIGSVLAKHLIAHFGDAKAIFDAPKGKLLKTPGIGNKIAEGILSFDLSLAESSLAQAQREGVSLLTFLDPAYPQRMKRILDSPSLIYAKGQADYNTPYTIGIVGSRKATHYGREVVEQVLEGLSMTVKPMIISGLAYGIDIHAHKTCLTLGLPTVAVMANGIDIIYPAAHANTARQMCERHGGLITEQPFGSKPDAPKFPERNRIIAAMSDAVIVVEAAEKGGALISADLASQYHVPVFAVPGSIFSPSSKGCNHLIANNQAMAFTDIPALISELGWDKEPLAVSKIIHAQNHLTGDAKQVFDALAGEPKHIDNLSIMTGIGLSRLASILLELEFDGMVRTLPGKRFEVSR